MRLPRNERRTGLEVDRIKNITIPNIGGLLAEHLSGGYCQAKFQLDDTGLNNSKMCKRYRFPAEIIQYAVWLYFRFNLSHRDNEDLLAQSGTIVTCESIRLWRNKFGSKFAAQIV